MFENSTEEFAPDGKPMSWYRQHLSAPSNADRLLLVHGKVAVFQGEADPQTPFDEIERFKKAGRKDLVLFRYPHLGHGFSPDKNGKPTLGPMDEKVLADVEKALENF